MRARALPDVNVLVALAWPNHVHHAPARAWFAAAAPEGWATAPVTESGFVRVSSNPRAVPRAGSPREALGILRRLCALGDHEFWMDDARLLEGEATRLTAYRQVTDAHLLTLTRRREGQLVTFDGGIADLVPPDERHLVVRLPG